MQQGNTSSDTVQQAGIVAGDVIKFLNALKVEEVLDGLLEYSVGSSGDYVGSIEVPYSTPKAVPPDILPFVVAGGVPYNQELQMCPAFGFLQTGPQYGGFLIGSNIVATALRDKVRVDSQLNSLATPNPVTLRIYVLRNKVNANILTNQSST